MSNSPKVSILLPVYNGESTLKATLESLIGQTFSDFELLIGIDGTKDGSKALAESFKDPRIKIFEHPKNLGLANNLNALLEKMCQESLYFAMAEQDDVYEPQRLEWQLEVLEKHPEVGLVSGIAKFVSPYNEILFPGLLIRGEQFPQGEDLFKFLYTYQLKVVNTCMMVRKKVHQSCGLRFNNFYGNFNVDWDYILRFALCSKIYGIPKVLVTMKRGETNNSVTRNKLGQHQASRMLLKRMKEEFPELVGNKLYRKALKEHRKIELGHHNKFKILLYSGSYFVKYLDSYFLKYSYYRFKKYNKKRR